MRYVQPYGEADTDAPYINGDPSIGRMGSIPPAAAFEHPMREIMALIEANKIIPDDLVLDQMMAAARSQRMNYAEDTGAVNNLTVAFDPPLLEYTVGLPIRVKVLHSNTGPCTIDASSTSQRVRIIKPTGAELSLDDIRAGGLAELVFDGAAFQLINFGGAGGAGGSVETFVVNVPYTVDAQTTSTPGYPNSVIANFSPAILTLVPGTIIMVRMVFTNTGLATINVNGIGAKPIYAIGGFAALPFLPGDIQTDDVVILTYDGSAFWITPNSSINIVCTLNVANTNDIVNVFKALSRKRIRNDVKVTIKMAPGIYGGFCTYHVDSKRIILEGTMKAGMTPPNAANFYKTGSAPAQRALDAQNNINMLRDRYATEIQFDNSIIPTFPGTYYSGQQGGAWLLHVGVGPILYKNFLMVGSNVASPNFTCAVQAYQVFMEGVCIWGSGGIGVGAWSGEEVHAWNCFICASWGPAWGAYVSSVMALKGCGAFGNAQNGIESGYGSSISVYNTNSQGNGWYGCSARDAANISVEYLSQVSMNGATDAFANLASTVTVYLSGTGVAVGTYSPAANTVGNSQSICIVI